MGKRFTDTAKWSDPWFRKLSPSAKLVYQFLLDSCDNAGIWQPDYDLADFQIGAPIDWNSVRPELGDRVQVLENGKWLLTRFIPFQYGELRAECKPHQQILRLIEEHGVAAILEGYRKGIQTLKDMEKDTDKEKDNGSVTAEQVYEEYPRKVAKQEAIKAIRRAADRLANEAVLNGLKSGMELLLQRTLLYSSATAKWRLEERQYIPYPATWFNQGRYDDDPKTWQRVSGTRDFCDSEQVRRFNEEAQ